MPPPFPHRSRVAVLVVIAALATPLSTGLGLVLATTTSALADKAAPFAIFNDNGGQRDRFQHILFLAETAKSQNERRHLYRKLGDVLQQVGRGQEALRAYEAGALEGDGPSASIVVDAMVKHRYSPHEPATLVRMAVLPKAEGGSVGAALLMSQLLGGGRVKGADLHTAGYWLDRAARLGSGDAQRTLARSAEQRGDIGAAATYYAMLDRTGGKLARALHQARAYMLGKDVKPNARIGLAWLSFAARIDANAAGKLAAKLVREQPGAESEERLLEIARAAGITPSTGVGGPTARLAAATTPEEREKVLADIETAARAGNGNAAILLWRTREADGLGGPALIPFLGMAARAGSSRALNEALHLLLAAPSPSTDTDQLVAAIAAVADEGNVDALTALANLYAAGGPVSADADKSFAYFRAAADQGDVQAAFRVGLAFAQDTLTADAPNLARHYLEAAATQGFAPARAYLDALPPVAAAPSLPPSPDPLANGV